MQLVLFIVAVSVPLLILLILRFYFHEAPQSFWYFSVADCSIPCLVLIYVWEALLYVQVAEYPSQLGGVDIKSACTFMLESAIYLCLIWTFACFMDSVLHWMKSRIPCKGMEETFDHLANWAAVLLKTLGIAIVFIAYLGLTSLFFNEEASTFRKSLASLVVGSVVLATVFLRQIAMSYLYLTYIIWEGHFSLGDEIVVYERDQGTVRGIVKSVDAHFTHIEGLDGTLCLVPNMLVVKAMLTRFTPSVHQSLEVHCCFDYNTTPSQFQAFVTKATLAASRVIDESLTAQQTMPSRSSPQSATAASPETGASAARVHLAQNPMQPCGVALTVGNDYWGIGKGGMRG